MAKGEKPIAVRRKQLYLKNFLPREALDKMLPSWHCYTYVRLNKADRRTERT